MGCEFMIRLDEGDAPVSDAFLESVLQHLPHYVGAVAYLDGTAFEFRVQSELGGMPDAYVIGHGREITICQFGDYLVSTLVIEALYQEPRLNT